MSTKAAKAKAKKTGSARPYNRYNIYFVLERENVVLSKGGSTKWSTSSSSSPSDEELREGLNLPPLPSRFRHLNLPADWCFPGRAAKRPHRRTHGVATFRELAQSIADSWKTIDEETMGFCSAVEMALKKRHLELLALEQAKSATNTSKAPALNDLKQLKPKIKPKQVKPKQIKPKQVKPKQVKLKQIPKSTQYKPIVRLVSDLLSNAAVSPTCPEVINSNTTRLLEDYRKAPYMLNTAKFTMTTGPSTRPIDTANKIVGLSSDPTAPAIIKEFFCEGLVSPPAAIAPATVNSLASEASSPQMAMGGDSYWSNSKHTGTFGETNNGQRDMFSSLLTSIQAATVTSQSNLPPFCPSNWAVGNQTQTQPTSIGNQTNFVAQNMDNNLGVVNISDDDIWKMWFLQH